MKKLKKGYSLVELAVVLTVLGIITCLAAPALGLMIEYWILEATAQELAQTIRQTQQLAVVNSRYYNFELDLKERYYKVRTQDPFAPSIKTVNIDSRIKKVSSTLQPSGSMDYRVITYTPTGIPGRTGSIVLETKNRKLTITIAVGTGRVRINR